MIRGEMGASHSYSPYFFTWHKSYFIQHNIVLFWRFWDSVSNHKVKKNNQSYGENWLWDSVSEDNGRNSTWYM